MNSITSDHCFVCLCNNISSRSCYTTNWWCIVPFVSWNKFRFFWHKSNVFITKVPISRKLLLTSFDCKFDKSQIKSTQCFWLSANRSVPTHESRLYWNNVITSSLAHLIPYVFSLNCYCYLRIWVMISTPMPRRHRILSDQKNDAPTPTWTSHVFNTSFETTGQCTTYLVSSTEGKISFFWFRLRNE